MESTETTSDTTTKITTENTSKRERTHSLLSEERSKEEEEIINKKDNINSYYSTSIDDTELPANSGDGELIQGIPVIDESYPSSWTSSSAGYLPSDFKVTDEMRKWVEEETREGRVKCGINIDQATHKFLLYNADKKKSNWINKWKLWIVNEKPEQSSSGYMTASQRQVEQFKRLAEEDPYADLTD